MKKRKTLSLLALVPILAASTVAAVVETNALPSPVAGGPVYSLEQFGPVGTTAQADATLHKASEEIIAHGGGMLIIPKTAPAVWVPQNTSQGEWRKPEPPAPTKSWGPTQAVTLLDYRDGTLKVYVPQVTGMDFERTFLLPEGQSSPHWEMHPLLNLKNTIVRGSTSYREWLLEDVKAGPDRRFYVRTIRGVFPGEFLNTGDYGQVVRINVKSLGYDTDRKLPYFVADTDIDVHHGALIHNKTHVNQIRLETYSHTENQTFDVMNWRYDYSQGDTYLYDGRFQYMSDVHSTAGDENGVIYAAFTKSMLNIFRGKVDSFDATTKALKFKGASNAQTLGTGRPMINLNPQKWITNGTVEIVRPATWWDLGAQGLQDPVFQGQIYPSQLVTNQYTGNKELSMGGLIRFSADAPVTEAVVGRYFAVDDPGEYAPGGAKVRRWYLIDSILKNADGTKDIRIIRHWWGAKSAGSPTLYKPENYTSDGHRKPLPYIIAPGANVYDVADAIGQGGIKQTVKVAPGPDTASSAGFASGDDIEQAIGPDPFKPIPMRAWVFDSVPGVFPSPIFDVANNGEIGRYSVMTVHGGGDDAKAITNRVDRSPPWQNILVINSVTDNGIVFSGDTLNAAIVFQQPHQRPQPIKWMYDGGRKEATLTVSPEDGTMKFDGGGVSAPGGLINVKGVSGGSTQANNLRGINVTVPEGAKELRVQFPRPEADAQYAVFLELNWLTNQAITGQTPEGFTVQFETPAGPNAKLHWILVR